MFAFHGDATVLRYQVFASQTRERLAADPAGVSRRNDISPTSGPMRAQHAQLEISEALAVGSRVSWVLALHETSLSLFGGSPV